jgi:F-type H+-transporting ATPase subunit a
MPPALERYLPYVAVLNFSAAAVVLLVLGRLVVSRPLVDLPGGLQNAGEAVLEWFVTQARRVHPSAVRLIAPFLASLFLMILVCNLLVLLPVPVLRIPPTSYFSVPFALALVAVTGAFVIGVRIRGIGAGLKHLFWPNPLQLVSELSHALSLSLRLYGIVGGEFIVATLVAQAVPYGIPLVVHAIGLVPASVQPIVFTLLTANSIATALHAERRPATAPERSVPS